MPKKEDGRLPKMEFRADPNIAKKIEALMNDTGLNRSAVIKLAITELAERRLAHKPR